MNICVYGAASNKVPQEFINKTEELGNLMASRGHTVVFGGGANGMMGAVARGAASGGGNILGIVPKFFNADGVLFKGCSELIFTDTMRQRKQLMEERSDGFIVAPGGIGTFDEFFEILTLRSLGRHSKPIAIFNVNGYYNALEQMLDNAIDGGFMEPAVKDLCGFFDCSKKLLDYLETYSGFTARVEDMKSV